MRLPSTARAAAALPFHNARLCLLKATHLHASVSFPDSYAQHGQPSIVLWQSLRAGRIAASGAIKIQMRALQLMALQRPSRYALAMPAQCFFRFQPRKAAAYRSDEAHPAISIFRSTIINGDHFLCFPGILPHTHTAGTWQSASRPAPHC